jgi:hypothetical protein
MMAEYKPGARLRSAVCATEVVVIAVPPRDVAVSCGNALMLAEAEEIVAGLVLDSLAASGTLLGKRYSNESGDLELLCVKPGEGSLSADGAALAVKGAKPLPSSD